MTTSNRKPIHPFISVNCNGKILNLVLHRKKDEWLRKYAKHSELWNIALEELLDGTLEINESMLYWLIDGRCYETDTFITPDK